MLTCHLTVKTNQWFVFANGTKLHGVQFKQLQTLGVYFAIYQQKKKPMFSSINHWIIKFWEMLCT